jgi:hypothetical protein
MWQTVQVWRIAPIKQNLGATGIQVAWTIPFAYDSPLPAALPLFATGLGVMGFLARRRKRKTAAVAEAPRARPGQPETPRAPRTTALGADSAGLGFNSPHPMRALSNFTRTYRFREIISTC